jgi:tRNA threonylcarbamoyladenosine modification (KEOPS) complex  Pcc1 subunit
MIKYGNRNPIKMNEERNALDRAIRAHDSEATEAAWEKVVQWLDVSFAALGVKK